MTFAEFFAGIGLVRLGLEQAGWDCRYANDINMSKAEIYRLNFGDKDLVVKDVAHVTREEVPTVDLAAASFPCQDLSLAGKRSGLAGERSGTFSEFARILRELKDDGRRPPLVLLENVTGLLTSHGGKDIRSVVKCLNDLGYSCDLLLIDAVRFVPQSRPRVFVIGVSAQLDQTLTWLQASQVPSHPFRPLIVQQVVERNLDLRWHFLDLPAPPAKGQQTLRDLVEESAVVKFLGDRLETELSYIRDRSRERLETALRVARNTGEAVYMAGFKRMRKGLVSLEIRDDDVAGCLRALSGGSSRQLLVAAYPDGTVGIRFMTAREYARLQGVPNTYRLPPNERNAVHAFGDAVAVPVLAWLGDVLRLTLKTNLDAQSRVALDLTDEVLVVNS
jgi:DNA (cytosine-5)-methyltransferase 1